MKPEMLPIIRDAGKLLVLDIEETSRSSKRRNLRKQTCSRQVMREMLWPNAKWWRYRILRGANELPASRTLERDLAVLAAWDELSSVTTWNAETLANVLLLLIETPFVERIYSLPLPVQVIRSMDLRPWLSDRAALREIVCRLSPFWSEAIRKLYRENKISAESYRRLKNSPPHQKQCSDPYALIHFGHREDISDITWKESEVRSCLAFFRGGTLRQARCALKTVDSILLSDPASITCLQRFLLQSRFSTAAPWVRLGKCFRQSQHRRHFFERLAVSEAKQHLPIPESEQLLRKIAKRGEVHNREALELASLFLIISKGLDPEALEDMFQLSTAITRHDAWMDLPKRITGRPDLNPLIELGRRMVCDEGNRRQQRYQSASNQLLRFWKVSLGSRCVRKTIENRVWDEFPDVATGDILRMILRINAITHTSGGFHQLLRHNLKLIRKFPPEKQPMRIRGCLRFLQRLDRIPDPQLRQCFEPFADTIARGFDTFPENAFRLVFEMRGHANADQRWTLGAIGRSAIKQMEQALRSERSASAIRNAVGPFLRFLPNIDLRICFRQPRQFLRLLRKIGAVPESGHACLMKAWNHHPALEVDPFRIGLEEACFLFDTILTNAQKDPVPVKLRKAACGQVELRGEIEEHYRDEFADRLASLWMEILEREIEHYMSVRQPRHLDPHTIDFLARLGKQNKRGLKRFLHSLETGNLSYRDDHPANQLWLKQHGRLSLQDWQSAGTPAFPVELPRIEQAVIRLEDDAQEELKMGTYVDSCLGIGGCNQHSAVANTLDINKRIAYLRDGDGQILARQLLAISEEEELVPFEVYRTQNQVPTDELERAFLEFDLYLSSALKIPLRRKESDYTIKSLVVPDWYDDYAWDFELPASS